MGFPAGKLTEWYPPAEELASALAWRGLELLPGADVKLPTSLSGEHYCAARAVATARATPDEAFGPLGTRLTRFALALLQARTEAEAELGSAEWKLETWLRERRR